MLFCNNFHRVATYATFLQVYSITYNITDQGFNDRVLMQVHTSEQETEIDSQNSTQEEKLAKSPTSSPGDVLTSVPQCSSSTTAYNSVSAAFLETPSSTVKPHASNKRKKDENEYEIINSTAKSLHQPVTVLAPPALSNPNV